MKTSKYPLKVSYSILLANGAILKFRSFHGNLITTYVKIVLWKLLFMNEKISFIGMDDAESEQSKDELNLEKRKLIDAGWIRPSG